MHTHLHLPRLRLVPGTNLLLTGGNAVSVQDAEQKGERSFHRCAVHKTHEPLESAGAHAMVQGVH